MSDVGRALLNLLVERPGEWELQYNGEVLWHLPTGIYLAPTTDGRVVVRAANADRTDALEFADHAALHPVVTKTLAEFAAKNPTDHKAVLRSLLKVVPAAELRAKILRLTLRVFGTPDAAERWMVRRNPEFGGETPEGLIAAGRGEIASDFLAGLLAGTSE